jgi:putative sterol carrier protein
MAIQNIKELFEVQIPERLKNKPDLAAKLNTTYKFIVTGTDAGTWIVDLTAPGGKVMSGDAPAKCTITIASADLVNIVNGQMNAQMAFMTGKLKVGGDMSLALKLSSLLG